MALQSIEKKKAELHAAKLEMSANPAKAKIKSLRLAMFFGWLVCLVLAIVLPIPLIGLAAGIMFVAWIVLLFVGMAV